MKKHKENMREILHLFFLVMIEALQTAKGPPDDINHLFRMSAAHNASHAFDVKSLDVNKLMRRVRTFNDSQDLPAHEIRRQQVIYEGLFYMSYYGYGSDYAAKVKLLDLMLQTIYMSKTILKELEDDDSFNMKDTGFRIGFLYRKLVRIKRKMHEIYTYMRTHVYLQTAHKLDEFLTMHTRVVRWHTDFLYFYWVLVRVDGVHVSLNRKGLPKGAPLPPALKGLGGFYLEQKKIG